MSPGYGPLPDLSGVFDPAMKENQNPSPGMNHRLPRLARPLRSPLTTFFFDEK